jgi:hypothetical protein
MEVVASISWNGTSRLWRDSRNDYWATLPVAALPPRCYDLVFHDPR